MDNRGRQIQIEFLLLFYTEDLLNTFDNRLCFVGGFFCSIFFLFIFTLNVYFGLASICRALPTNDLLSVLLAASFGSCVSAVYKAT